MLRTRLKDALTEAKEAKDKVSTNTLRLILAALKDRDMTARAKGETIAIDDDAILELLQSMVRQRRESIATYQAAGRRDLAQLEQQEIEVISRFLPRQMSEEETVAAVSAVIAELEAKTLKDIGRTMATLRERYPGRMDFVRASTEVRKQLAA